MAPLLQTESTLTNRFQTTVPEAVRKALNLKKRDKIVFSLQSNGQVLLSRAEDNGDDPVLDKFLEFIAKDMQQSPQHVTAISEVLLTRIQKLVSGVEIDLDSPLSDEDE